jgi:hypothetical protein
MNWYSIFYWITRADSVKDFFDATSNWFLFFTIMCLLGRFITTIAYNSTLSENNNGKEEVAWLNTGKYFRNGLITFGILSLITWSSYVFVPSKKEMLLIVGAGGTLNYLTTDSVGKQIPHELSTFVINELKVLSKEAKVDLGIANQKDKVLEQVKELSAVELIEKMKVDSNLAKIVMEK